MVKVDLITGFLGSGKTTFIHKYIDYLTRMGQKVHVIENEFGSVGIDKIFLKEDDCGVSDLSGVCMCCKGKQMFMDMLVAGSRQGYDRILVEPSGIYDVDEFFSTMASDQVRDYCQIGSILTIVDAHLDHLSEEALYLMFSQLLAAGPVIMSKTQLFDAAQISQTLDQINGLMREHGSSRSFSSQGADVCLKPWEELQDEDFRRFMESGYCILEHKRELMQHDEIFDAETMADLCRDQEDLKERLTRLMQEEAFYGNILRMKGHIQDLEGNWYEVNCSKDVMTIRPSQVKRGIYVIIGQHVNDKALHTAFIPRQGRKIRKAEEGVGSCG